MLSEPAQAKRGARHQLAEHVLRFIKERAHLPISEEAAALEFAQSPSSFSRFFKREFGKSFSRYVAELRVGRASNLLLSEQLEVQAIAQLAGFGTVASLNRHFRAIKMTTPTAYRRRARELNVGLRAAQGEILRCDGAGRRPERHATPDVSGKP
jgi:AraC-like DNA-binding protein